MNQKTCNTNIIKFINVDLFFLTPFSTRKQFFNTKNKPFENTKSKRQLKKNEEFNNLNNTSRDIEEGIKVPYRFKLTKQEGEDESQWTRNVNPNLDYSDHSGNRFPTLSTSQNFGYWKDHGLDRLINRKFPFKIPAQRKIDPLMREYIFFLHSLDPARFSDTKIGDRYCLKSDVVRKIREWYQNRKMISDTKLGTAKTARITREEAVLQFKEKIYADYIGYQFRGDNETYTEQQLKGHKSTLDWVNLQSIQIESISAFPMMEKRNPQLKRVEVDITVDSTPKYKIMDWVDPTDKIVF